MIEPDPLRSNLVQRPTGSSLVVCVFQPAPAGKINLGRQHGFYRRDRNQLCLQGATALLISTIFILPPVRKKLNIYQWILSMAIVTKDG